MLVMKQWDCILKEFPPNVGQCGTSIVSCDPINCQSIVDTLDLNPTAAALFCNTTPGFSDSAVCVVNSLQVPRQRNINLSSNHIN